jgi:glucose-6-phosphate 1-dehydrogenase
MSHGFAQETQRLFYLSIPPQISGGIIRQLGESGLAQMKNTKLLLEKPFGTDLASAEDLISTTSQHFREEQIYRIDHYLAKEMAQNILVFRNGNSLFKKTWNSSFIEKIDILATESIGIEGRNIFYEQTGALRDVLQSHLLQLAALTLMELPSNDDWSRVSELRLAALKQLELPQPGLFYHYVKRGQYQGYREEVENPKSQVETFVSMTLFSNNQRWQNVPITLTTGKALDKRLTEIRVSYRKQEDNEANQLIFRIQPDEGIALQLWSKKPGYEHRVEQVKLSFAYEDHQQELAQAYEQVLIDALKGDHRLFTSSEEVLASWKILAPVQKQWALEEKDLIFYEAGSSLQQVCQKMN